MATVKLTDTYIKALPTPEKRTQISDGRAPNLVLILFPSGARVWYWRGRIEGSIASIKLGPYPDHSLIEARAWAAEQRKLRAVGENPAAKLKAARAKKVAELVDQARTVDAIWAIYFDRHVSKLKDANNQRAKYVNELKPIIGRRPISSITYDELVDIVLAKGARYPIAANRLHALISAFLRWARTQGKLESGLTQNVYLEAQKPFREGSRERYLSDEEIVWLYRALDLETQQVRSMYRLLLLTGTRRSEVARMERREIDLAAKLWTIPGARTKNGIEHLVPLSTEAKLEIDILMRATNDHRWLFPSMARIDHDEEGDEEKGVENPMSGFSRFQRRIRRNMSKLALVDYPRADPKTVIPNWVVHDLRRTAATVMGQERLGGRAEHIEAAINHISGTKKGVAGRYNRNDYLAEKRELLLRYGALITTITRRLWPSTL